VGLRRVISAEGTVDGKEMKNLGGGKLTGGQKLSTVGLERGVLLLGRKLSSPIWDKKGKSYVWGEKLPSFGKKNGEKTENWRKRGKGFRLPRKRNTGGGGVGEGDTSIGRLGVGGREGERPVTKKKKKKKRMLGGVSCALESVVGVGESLKGEYLQGEKTYLNRNSTNLPKPRWWG